MPPPPTIPPAEAEDLRRLLGAATSADECRLLVDLFLVKNGFALKEPMAASSAADATGTPKLEDALALAAQEAQEVERGLVALFLGGGGQIDLSGFPSPSLQRAASESGSTQSPREGSEPGSAAELDHAEPVAGELQQQQQQQFRWSPVSSSH